MSHLPLSLEAAPYHPDVRANQNAMHQAMREKGIDLLVVGSADCFLSEYTPPGDNERVALTGFRGSEGDGVFLSPEAQRALGARAPFVLMVDGRYHLQADKECDPELVQVQKLSLAEPVNEAPLRWIDAALSGNPHQKLTLAIDGPRTSWGRFQSLKSLCEKHEANLIVLGDDDVTGPLRIPGAQVSRPVRSVPFSLSGRTSAGTLAALQRLLPEGCMPHETCIMTCASDDAAFLLNARGYHAKNSSAVKAWTFSVGRNLVVFLPEGAHEAAFDLTATEGVTLHVVRKSVAELSQTLSRFPEVRTIAFSARNTNAWLPTFAEGLWPRARLFERFHHLTGMRATKTPEELVCMRNNFLAQSRALAQTLRWIRASVEIEDGEATSDPQFAAPISEASVASKIAKEYGAEGAVTLSFDTIASVDETAAIVHYHDCSPTRLVRPGSMVLLDSGAYFAGGFSTDCTRVVFCPGRENRKPADWQMQIYTVCLKSFVAGMSATFPKNAPGRDWDTRIRSVSRERGFDYAHGTGHGIGILVHEAGHSIRIDGFAWQPLAENGTISVEPGIYLAGKGGVRIENIVAVREHPEKHDHFQLENLTWVGLDWSLVDLTQLDDGEKEWLRNYERRCLEVGTSVTPCPLL